MKPPSSLALHATPEASPFAPSESAQADSEPWRSPPQGGRPLADRQSRIRGGKLDPAPRALPPRKARCADECERLEQLPNIGPSIAADLRSLGILHPRELASRDALQLYQALCTHTGKRQDPCVLDTFMAATEFMRGGPARPWWDFTAERKARFGVL